MDINESDCGAVTNTTSSSNYNMGQDSTEDIYNNGEFIPNNNFEDGYENSEIIELNDSTQHVDDEDLDLSVDSGSVIHHMPSRVRGSVDVGAIVSNTTTALSVKVVLSKLTSTTFNTTFSGVIIVLCIIP